MGAGRTVALVGKEIQTLPDEGGGGGGVSGTFGDASTALQITVVDGLVTVVNEFPIGGGVSAKAALFNDITWNAGADTTLILDLDTEVYDSDAAMNLSFAYGALPNLPAPFIPSSPSTAFIAPRDGVYHVTLAMHITGTNLDNKFSAAISHFKADGTPRYTDPSGSDEQFNSPKENLAPAGGIFNDGDGIVFNGDIPMIAGEFLLPSLVRGDPTGAITVSGYHTMFEVHRVADLPASVTYF